MKTKQQTKKHYLLLFYLIAFTFTGIVGGLNPHWLEGVVAFITPTTEMVWEEAQVIESVIIESEEPKVVRKHKRDPNSSISAIRSKVIKPIHGKMDSDDDDDEAMDLDDEAMDPADEDEDIADGSIMIPEKEQFGTMMAFVSGIMGAVASHWINVGIAFVFRRKRK